MGPHRALKGPIGLGPLLGVLSGLFPSYIAFVITLVIVPFASVIHWSTSFNAEDSENKIVTWLSIYPMMGLMNCLYLFTQTDKD